MSIADLPERAVRAIDDFQQRHRWSAQLVGTVRKYGDDRGSAFAGIVTYQVFLGMLPLLVVVLTVLGGILEGSERLREAVLDSTVAQFPVVGSRIENDVSALSVGGPWLYIAIAGLFYTSFGIFHSLQLALSQVWNVDGVFRQGFVSRHLRALLLYVMLFAAAVGTALLRDVPLLQWGSSPPARLASFLLATSLAGLLLLGVFRLALASVVPTSHLVPAAALAGLLWEVLQRLGAWIVTDRLVDAEDLYGTIGFVVVILFWINLLAQAIVLSNEAAVVARRRLWPRRIAQPPLSEADQRVLVHLVANERRRPEQIIEVRFDDEIDSVEKLRAAEAEPE